MSSNVAVTVDNVGKSYGDFRAVDGVSFIVNRGEIFAMLGPNGAGKSTTIRMMLDILKPDTGTIHILGGPINDRTKDRIGYLPEERGLYRNGKVIEVMTYLGSLKGMSYRDAHKQAMSLLERLELADKADKKVSEYSKGMQQKVQFAVTIMHDPDLIIVDEPFSGLDPVNTLVIKDLINEMRDNGKAVIMSTHQMHQVEEMADRLLMINHGKTALYGPVEQVRRENALHAVIVEGEGDWNSLPIVKAVETRGKDNGETVVHLQPDSAPNDLLAAIAANPRMKVTRFELAVPGLNDIFIAVAGERITQTGEVEQVKRGEPVYE